jgi:hypothetical protein
MNDHVARLHERIELLQRELEATASEAPYAELLKIIHRPGWTTPAEILLTTAAVDNLVAQVAAVRGTNQGLMAGAREVAAATRA